MSPNKQPPLSFLQSLLQAVGVGGRRSLPAAATINWVLKDGLGRLGRLSVATQFGASFDADLKACMWGPGMMLPRRVLWRGGDGKGVGMLRPSHMGSCPDTHTHSTRTHTAHTWQRFRYSTSVLYCIALGLEYLTPLVPKAFLPLASLANVGKSIGLATYVATQACRLRGFCCCCCCGVSCVGRGESALGRTGGASRQT